MAPSLSPAMIMSSYQQIAIVFPTPDRVNFLALAIDAFTTLFSTFPPPPTHKVIRP
jgi:hypothetical protein